MRSTFLLRLSGIRALTPQTLLETVRNDPGKTAPYYANRYFGSERANEVNHLLWTNLKMFNKVELHRSEKVTEPPTWIPVLEFHRRHSARLHDPEEEDLTLLRQYEENSSNFSESISTSSAKSSSSESDNSALHDKGNTGETVTASFSSSSSTRTSNFGMSDRDNKHKNIEQEKSKSDNTAEAAALELESTIMNAVQLEPGKDIQYYISTLPDDMQLQAPSAFKRLREAGLLERISTEKGTFVWK